MGYEVRVVIGRPSGLTIGGKETIIEDFVFDCQKVSYSAELFRLCKEEGEGNPTHLYPLLSHQDLPPIEEDSYGKPLSIVALDDVADAIEEDIRAGQYPREFIYPYVVLDCIKRIQDAGRGDEFVAVLLGH